MRKKAFIIALILVTLIGGGLAYADHRQATQAPKVDKQTVEKEKAVTEPVNAPQSEVQAKEPVQQIQKPVPAKAPVSTPQTAKASCPDGTYNINTEADPVCKQQPTGCPYADSIPVDSPKCVPPEVRQ